MIATLRKTKAELSRMVRLATNGEEVVITVRGTPVAKLVGISPAPGERARKKWLNEIRTLREDCATGKYGSTSEELLDEDRADRDL